MARLRAQDRVRSLLQRALADDSAASAGGGGTDGAVADAESGEEVDETAGQRAIEELERALEEVMVFCMRQT